MAHGSELEVVQEDLLLQKLSKLQTVELWRVHWGLIQNLHENIPPIPPHWLWSADSCKTAKIMQRCYDKEVALKVLTRVLKLIGQHSQGLHLSDTIKLLEPITTPKLGPDFVKMNRRLLISRMQRPDAILDSLQSYQILNNANSHSEPFLVQELGDNPPKDKDPSGTSVLTDMLDFLTSDEFRCFQWLVKDYITKEAHDLFNEEAPERQTMQLFLQKYFGLKQAETIARNVILSIVPVLSVCIPEEEGTSQRSSYIRVDADATMVEATPETHDDGNMFRLVSQQPGVSRCHLTGLLLEGFGDVVYEMVPWDLDFLSSKGLRPAGPLYRFRVLKGSFHRLYLPHCQLLQDSGQHFLSVVHITKDHMDLMSPVEVTDSHVIVNVSSFSCFGLVTKAAYVAPINGLVLLFSMSTNSSLFVLLLPRNVSLTQVQREWKRRIGAEYVEVIPDCELIPNQTYKLSGKPVAFIQPESSKFVNYSDYNNFLPSFQVQLADGVSQVELQLKSEEAPHSLIAWLFGSTNRVVWSRTVQLRAAAASTVFADESVDVSLLLIDTLNSLTSDDFKTFQHHLHYQSDSIPVSWLETAGRTRTVELMVQRYHTEGATEVTTEILKKMKCNQLADQLQKSSCQIVSPRGCLTAVQEAFQPFLHYISDFVTCRPVNLPVGPEKDCRCQDAASRCLLDSLQAYQILNNANRDVINIYAICKDKARALLDLVLWKGDKAVLLCSQPIGAIPSWEIIHPGTRRVQMFPVVGQGLHH
ncbi:hypothetical protein Q5P01_015605 [Channa striata]|uniref:Uncharacterized protein n=1 Tax=Channa striata TaxID=64152 RepID=A0AA88SFE5_CHASR|nr:hypothetical protein Q5P01_015605 [Channa striata]